MSFWENNKGSFKSAGMATVKGIGSGGKALGKAGYGAYKKNEAKRKGLPEPTNDEEEEKDGEPNANTYSGSSMGGLPKEQLNSLPAPPRRTGPINAVGEGAAQYRAQQQQQNLQYQHQTQPSVQQVQPQYQQSQYQQQQFQQPQNQQPQELQSQQYQPEQPIQQQQLYQPQQSMYQPQQHPQPFQLQNESPHQQPQQQAQPQQQQPQQQQPQQQQAQAQQPQQQLQQQFQNQFQQAAQDHITRSIKNAVFGQPAPSNQQANSTAAPVYNNDTEMQYSQLQPQYQSQPQPQVQSHPQPQAQPQAQLQQPLQQQLQNQFQQAAQNHISANIKNAISGQLTPANQTNISPAPPVYDKSTEILSADPNANRALPPPPPPRTNTVGSASAIPSNPLNQTPHNLTLSNPYHTPPTAFAADTSQQYQESPPPISNQTPTDQVQEQAPVHQNFVSPYPAYNPNNKPLPVKKELPDPASFAPPPRHKLAVAAGKIANNSKPSTSNKYQPKPVAANLSSTDNYSLAHLPPPPGYHEIDRTSTSPPASVPTSSTAQKAEKVPPTKPSKPAKPAKLAQQPTNDSLNLDISTSNSSIKRKDTWERELPPPMPTRRTDFSSTGRQQTNDLPLLSAEPLVSSHEAINDVREMFKMAVKPPTMPVKKFSNDISSSVNDAHTPETKKIAPPKPTKKIQSESTGSTSVSINESAPKHSFNNTVTPNFAQEISKRISTANAQDNDILHKPSPMKPLTKPNNFQSSSFLNELNGSLNKLNIDNDSSTKLAANKHEIGNKPIVGKKPTVEKPKVAPKPSIGVPEIESQSTTTSISNELKSLNVPAPPPPRKSVSPSPSRTSNNPSPVPPPPPARNYSMPMAAAPVAKDQPPTIDLELSTGWFADQSNFKYPNDLTGLGSSTSWSSRNDDCTRVVKVRMKDLSIIEYKFDWRKDNISSVKAEMTRFIPSPITCNVPSKSELVNFYNKFGEHVASWCEHNIGKQILRGECWDLAHEALLKGCGKHAFVSTGLHHGFPILQIKAQDGGIIFTNSTGPADEIRRGDIIQFKSCKFVNPENGSSQSAGMPDHTAVVVANNIDGKLGVLHQNVGGKRYVVPGEYILKSLVEGSVCVYRPAPVEWAGAL